MPKPVDKLLKLDKSALENFLIQLQQKNEQTESLIQKLPIGILGLDDNNRISWANEAGENILGSRITSGRGIPINSVIVDHEFKNWFETALKTNRGVFNEEKEVLFPKHRHLLVTVRPSQMIVLVDITSIRSRDRETGDLERINSLIKLSRGIAHELGNPLNSITIHLKLLAKIGESLPAKEKKKFQDALGVLTHETDRLDRIIKNFLKATRQKPPEFKLGDIHDPIEEALNFLAPELKADKIKVKTDFSKSIPEFLFDRDKMYQAFLNLIKNAVEAMPKGGELRIGTAAREKVCSIAFQDNGIGIPEKDLPYIFEEYYTTKEEGSGLGLAILYNIIREHGGRIDVKSQEGKGTLFILLLPIRRDKLQLPMNTTGAKE